MFCKLYVSVVLIYSIMVAGIHAQNLFISKSISLTTLIGETVEINCSENNMESQKSSTQLIWYKNEEPLRKKISFKMSLHGFNDILRITEVTNEDAGTYKCVTFNQTHSDYSIYTLTVNGLPELIPYYVYISNITASKDLTVFIRCMRYMYHDGKNYSNQNHLYFKDETPLIFNESNKRMWVDENFNFKIDPIRYEDNGAYKCVSSNKFRIDYAVTYLNIVEKDYYHRHEYFYDEIVNETKHLNENFSLRYFGEPWFKNDKPINVSEENPHIKIYYKTSKFEIENLTFEDAGNYRLNLSDRFQTYNLHYSLNVIDRPEKLYFRLFNSNISLIIGKTFQLKCHIFQSTENYTTWYSWKKNGKKLVFNNNTKNIRLKKNQSILQLSDLSINEIGTYECEAESYYHKVYSAYTLTIPVTDARNSFISKSISLTTLIGETVEFNCSENNMESQKSTTQLIWYKNQKSLNKIMENNSSKISLAGDNNIVVRITNVTNEDAGTYKCVTFNQTHIDYSIYALTVKDKQNNIEQVTLIWSYCTYVTICVLIGAVTILCCNLWLTVLWRKQTTTKDTEANKLQCLNGNRENWNTDSGIEEQISESPYDNVIYEMINSPLNRSTMSGDNSGLHLENSTEKQKDKLPCDNQWEFPINKLELGKKLGSGEFGEVFKAEAIGLTKKISTTVAVKKVKTVTDPLQAKALIDEMEIMLQIGKHINLVNVLGTCKGDNDNNLMLILEYCQYGNLSDYLLKQRNGFINHITSDGLLKYDMSKTKQCNVNGRLVPTNLDNTGENVLIDENDAACSKNNHGDCNNENIPSLCTHDLISWSFQISRGMEYLSSKRILHRDLATRNILLADDNIVKICDFGLARTLVYQNHDIYTMTNNVRLPWKWMAIESLFDREFSTHSDVWSFGIVLWELFSLAETPYPNIQSVNYLCEKLINGYRMEQPKYANCEIYNIMYDCWKTDPKSRPFFSDLHKRFSLIIQASSNNHYLDLNEAFNRTYKKTSHSIIQIENVISPFNRSTMSSENSGLHLHHSNQSRSNDEIEMKHIVHDQGQESSTKVYDQTK